MHHHALGLIDHQKITVLIPDIQWNLLRLCFQLARLVQENADAVPRFHPLILRNGSPILNHIPLFDQALHGRTA